MKEAISKYMKEHGLEVYKPKSVLFDMDGVLYDSMKYHAMAWNKAMAKYGIDMTEHQAYLYEGMRGVEAIAIMCREQWGREIPESEAMEMYMEKSRIFHSLTSAEIMPGVKELQRTMLDIGLSISVVTGSGQPPLLEKLSNDFRDYIDTARIVSAKDVNKGKPAPDPYLLGMKKAGSTPTETIVVENAPLGVQSGKAAGCFVIAVNTGPLPDSVLSESGADVVFHDMFEVRKAITEFFSNEKTLC